ncbi:MAG: membrane protein YqaA with SNARE-associated domain [Rickettsiales bacterium]|jgi:membrane protein YqaA with SNARE-associated domain
MTDLIFLFASSFLAATIFPAGSEIILATLNISGNHDKFLLLATATIGNVLGALVNWFIGYYLIKFKDKKWFPLKQRRLKKYSDIYKKWGVWSLLLAWLPFIGDPLTVMAGIFKTNIWLFLLLVTIGKASRYLFIILVF